MKTSSPPLETAVQACVRLGFKKGDRLVSKFWDVPLRISEIFEKELWVTRQKQVTPGVWQGGASHTMKYLPADVRKKEGT